MTYLWVHRLLSLIKLAAAALYSTFYFIVFFSSRIYLVLFYDFYWRSSHLLYSLMTGFGRKIVSPVWLRILRLSMESPTLHLLFPLGSELLKLCAFSQFYKARPDAWEPRICFPWGWCPNGAFLQSCSQVDFLHMLTSHLQKLAFIIHRRMLREPAVRVVGERIRASEAHRASRASMGQLGGPVSKVSQVACGASSWWSLCRRTQSPLSSESWLLCS